MLPAASPAIPHVSSSVFPLFDQLLAPILGHHISCCVHGRDAAFILFRILRGHEHQQGVDLGALAQLLLPFGLLGLLLKLGFRLGSAGRFPLRARLYEQLIEGSYQSRLGVDAVLEINA